jgi:phage terminase large subunit-like protein
MNGPAWIYDGSEIADPLGYGERAMAFLKLLKHPKSRAPDRALTIDPWQDRIVRRIYGPCGENGRRITRVVYLQVGHGNRKTSLGAALALLHTFGPEREPSGQVISAAADRKQARIAFEEALGIVGAVPQLASAARPQDFKNRLLHPKSGAVYEAISADAATQYGRTPVFALVDELWAHKKINLWHAIRTGLAKVAGSLLVIATTAGRGTETPDFPIYDYARKVASGEIVDPSFLPIIFEAPKDCDWRDESIWHAVNPGLKYGYPDLDGLRQLAHEAEVRPADRAAFMQFHLGIRLDYSSDPFVDMDVYDEGEEPVDLEALKGEPCWIAVDMGLTTDLTAVVAAWRDGDDGYAVAAWFFCPADNLAAERFRASMLKDINRDSS